MSSNLILACGCSFTAGFTFHGNVVSYGEVLSKELNSDFINLAFPGSSCYRIAKQIEHSITLKPKLVIVGITTPLRYEFNINGNINSRPFLNDFTDNPYKILTSKIETRSLISLDRFIHDETITEQNKLHYSNIFSYYDKYGNVHIKRDQDQFIIAGACSLLAKENIQYITIQFDTQPFIHARENHFHMSYTELVKKFPVPKDTVHFNQNGHHYLSEMLYNHICQQKLW